MPDLLLLFGLMLLVFAVRIHSDGKYHPTWGDRVDGYYYATFFKYYRRILAHPEVLDNPPDTVAKDID